MQIAGRQAQMPRRAAAKPEHKNILPPGRIIASRFQIIDAIVTMSMSNIYLAFDLVRQRDVVLKTVELNNMGMDFNKYFEAETDTLGNLPRPADGEPGYFPELYDHGTFELTRKIAGTEAYETVPLGYMAMEEIKGLTLGALIYNREERIPLWQAIEITMSVLKGLDILHEQGLVDRDVKPGNVMIENVTGRTRLIDLGTVCPEGYRDPKGLTLGTPAYIAPEQAAGLPAQRSTDIYAVGLMLFEMIARYNPMRNGTPQQNIENQIIRPMDPLPEQEITGRFSPEVSGHLSELISTAHRQLALLVEVMTQKNPAHRPTTAMLLGLLENALANARALEPYESLIKIDPVKFSPRNPDKILDQTRALKM